MPLVTPIGWDPSRAVLAILSEVSRFTMEKYRVCFWLAGMFVTLLLGFRSDADAAAQSSGVS
ncbi:MAG: hypothetical protein H6714_05825 [Myxococcales bacterium]|nr:hypothetical protein [Myxococcales bacterium]